MSRPLTPSTSSNSTVGVSTSFSAPRHPATVAVDTSTAIGSASLDGSRKASVSGREGRARELSDSSIGEKALATDARTRKDWARYTTSVDRTLQSFESVSEWADFITFLGKLLKCLQAYPNFAYIPHKLVVAKRLAQCLNPALPTGVHQRALDVYVHILNAIGPENLRRDLQLWSSGLFPFFQYAATSVRPIVLGIYTRFYIPLQEALRPATKAMILALLPGLEEEAGEFFEKVSSLLDQLSGTVSPAFFLQNIWLVLITAPSLRIAALNYLSKRMPRIDPQDSIGPIVGDDVGLMVRAFASALGDSQILVQRAALDLVTSTLRIDGAGFQKDTRREEQLLLMRAMSGVVLRRDLSLSRRLYAWLLGTSEEDTAQVAYLKQNGLSLLHEALIGEIHAAAEDSHDLAARQRPYKIVISLFDKWEISYPLTEVIVLNLLRTLKKARHADELQDELLVTANTLFDGLDPFILWRQLFLAAKSQLLGQEGHADDALDLMAFVVQTFRLNDDEVSRLHAPLVAFAFLDVVAELSVKQESSEDQLVAISLAHALLKETSPSFFASSALSQDGGKDEKHTGLNIAGDFYSAQDNKSARVPPTGFAGRLVSNGLRAVIDLIGLCIDREPLSSDLLLSSLHLLGYMAELSPRDQPVALASLTNDWMNGLLGSISKAPHDQAGFDRVDAGINCILALVAAPIEPPFSVDNRASISLLVDTLLSFLQPSCARYHVQAVSLIWALEDLSQSKHVEASICYRLASQDPVVRQAAYEAFGNLWRFTEDSQLPGVRLKVPMYIMLDALRSSDLSAKRAGEAWMRCSLKSYLRILDPLLFSLLSPKILRRPAQLKIADIELEVEQYQHVFDMAQTQYILENLLSLAGFGGQGFTRLAKTSYLQQSPYSDLKSRTEASGLANESYLDALVTLLTRFLQSEAVPDLIPAIEPANRHIHAISADLLQSILSRGELDSSMLQKVRSALVTRLHLCVHRGEYDLQNKLLHVLHSAIVALSEARKKADRRSTVTSRHRAASVSRTSTEKPALHLESEAHDASLLKLLSDGITQRNSAMLHHWVDFLLITLPHLRKILVSLLVPLIDCISGRIRTFVEELRAAFDPDVKGKEVSTDASDADFAILMNALERLFVLAMEEAKPLMAQEEDSAHAEKPVSAGDGHGGLFSFMSNALSSADGTSIQHDSTSKTKTLIGSKLADFMALLLSLWDVSGHLEAASEGDESTSQGYLGVHIQARTKKAFERMFRSNPTEVVEGIVEGWHREQMSSNIHAGDRQARMFELLDHLSSSASSIVTMLCDLISSQFGPEKHKTSAASPTDYESIRFEFLEAYVERIDGAYAVQVWNPFHTFIKDFITAPVVHKYRLLPSLRCLTSLAEKIMQTSALEDKRLRRDLHETFMKLVDATIQMSGRSGDGLRRPTHDHSSVSTPVPSDVNGASEHKLDASYVSEKSANAIRSQDSARELALFLAQRVVPDFRRFSIDNDKLAATCANIMYYNISPAFKTRTRSFDVDDSILELLLEITKVPAALKSWRTQVLEVFSDNRFFYGPPSTSSKWRGIVQALVASDKERFPDLIAKISAGSSANIFVNREFEALSKAMSIRRLSYTIFCGEKNRYLVQLPAIQEKVVELLRAQVSDLVHSEVYLCLRVLLCRIGNQHLSSFWPIILTELLRLFESLMHDSSALSTEYLQLILSACKFLDLLLVLQTEEFQIHQWMFITDTVDAAYPPESWTPAAIMDRLGEIVSTRHLPGSSGYSHGRQMSLTPKAALALNGYRPPQSSRPLLGRIRQSKITSLSALEPFFQRASLSNYEAVYALGGVDWQAVETSVEMDLFEGDE